jgi:uncharacterized protein YqgV (UPF0045/DUF77 family)
MNFVESWACADGWSRCSHSVDPYAEFVLRAEFTVEPFVEGRPGPHVRAAIAAVEARGFIVEFGPFATSFSGDESSVASAIEALIRDAYGEGATRVAVHVERIQGVAGSESRS